MRKILIYPDKRLRQVGAEAVRFDDSLAELLDDMNEAMIASGGVGLAAIQVGEPIRAFIVNIPGDDGLQTQETLIEFVNPRITASEGQVWWSEGCLSIPEYNEEVLRSERIKVEFFNRRGEPQSLEADGLLAIAIQHEYDHLEGRLFVERLSLLKRKKFEKEWKKQLRNAL